MNLGRVASTGAGEYHAGEVSGGMLGEDEEPYETFTQWGLSAWPVKFFVPGEPMDSYGDGFFERENAHVMTGEELADPDATGRAAAMFGIVSRMQLCMTLVTDKRLLWRPLSHTAPPPLDEPGSYATYPEASMGQRCVDLGSIEYVESAFITDVGALRRLSTLVRQFR
jgi:hypothetical protein